MEEKMQAVIVLLPGGVDKLKIAEVGKPVPKEDEILVKVHATSLK